MYTAPAVAELLAIYLDDAITGSGPYGQWLGDSSKEDSLVAWCVSENLKYAAIYETQMLRSGAAYTTAGKALLTSFLAKLDTAGIEVGFIISGSANSVDAIVDFNATQPYPVQWANIENEWWNGAISYATYQSQLIYADTALGAISVGVEIYIGWPDPGEMAGLLPYIDRLLIHDYTVLEPTLAYTYGRLVEIASSTTNIQILQIVSAESTTANKSGVSDTSFNFAGYLFEGRDSLGNIFTTPKSIPWVYKNYYISGVSGNPNSYNSIPAGNVRDYIYPLGTIIFTQALLRSLTYEAATPITIPPPTVSISGPTTINSGPATFTAIIQLGYNVKITWLLNGVVDGTGISHTYTTLTDGDVIAILVEDLVSPSTWGKVYSSDYTITVISPPLCPNIFPSGTVYLPLNGSLLLTSSYPGGNQWSTGAFGTTLRVTQPGVYSVEAIGPTGIRTAACSTVTVLRTTQSNVQPLPRVGEDAHSPALAPAIPESLSALDLRTDNPYSIGAVINYGDSLSSLNRTPIRYPADQQDIYHLVTYDDNLWSLSFKYFNTSKLWWVLQDVNNLENGFELPVGETILIPNLIKLRLQQS